jgi:hypothetical protein
MSPEIVNGLFAIAGAVIGALLTGAVSFYQTRKSSRRKELTIVSKYPSRLVEVDEQFSKHVEVRVDGKVVPTVFVVDFVVLNSGSEVLDNLEVPVTYRGDGEVVAVSLGETNFSAGPEDCIVEQRDPHSVLLRLKYLNPGDEAAVWVILSGRPRELTNDFRQPGVRCHQRLELAGSERGAVTEALFQYVHRNPLLDMYMTIALPAYRSYARARRKNKPA